MKKTVEIEKSGSAGEIENDVAKVSRRGWLMWLGAPAGVVMALATGGCATRGTARRTSRRTARRVTRRRF